MIEVLRLHHRLPRDVRISTHCCLVSRAFGASRIYYEGMKDKSLEQSVSGVVSEFGGKFSIEYVSNGLKFVEGKKKDGFIVVHLTMYGEKFVKKVSELKKLDKVLLIVGSEKVEPEYYNLADFNIAVGNQPHSEVAALGVVLYEMSGIVDEFAGGKVEVFPCVSGKDVREKQ